MRKKTKKREFIVVIERDADGYLIASVPEINIPGCHTQAKSLDSLMKRIREVIELCLEEQGDVGDGFEFVGIHRISVIAPSF